MIGGSLSSFYHVFVTRREREENFIWERSRCDNCHKKLKFYEMIPVFSYIFLRGRCSRCKSKIGIDKFITELISSVLAILFFYKYGFSISTIYVILVSIVLLFIGLVDLKTGYIHNVDLILLFIFATLYNLSLGINLFISLKYGSILFAIFFIIYFATKMMGLGDVFFAFVMGLFATSNLEVFVIFKNSFIFAAIISIILILIKRKKPKDEIAFGPYMSMSILYFLLFYRWVMFEKNTYIIRLKDGYVEFINGEKSHLFSMPFKVYRDGNILDYHHFYYKFKKSVDNLELNKVDNIILTIDSSEVIHINYKIPKIKEDEIDDFLKLELEDYGDFNINEYEIFHKEVESSNALEISIILMPLKLKKSLSEILEKLEIKNYKILPEFILISQDGKFVELGVDYVILTEIKDGQIRELEKIYNNNLQNLLEENNLEEKNASNIINKKYDPEENKIEDDFFLKFENFFMDSVLRIENFAKEDEIKIYGRISDSSVVKDILDNYSNLKYKLIDEKLVLNYKPKIKREKKKINYINFIFPIGLILILIFSFMRINSINNKINLIPEVENKVQEVNEYSSDIYQNKNKVFLNYVSEIQNLEDKDLVITNYSFENGTMYVRGIVIDENYLKKKFKDYKILSQNIYMENGFNKFEIQIKW